MTGWTGRVGDVVGGLILATFFRFGFLATGFFFLVVSVILDH